MPSSTHQLRANISLTTVLVVTAILLLSGITILMTSADLAKNSRSLFNAKQNTFQLQSCVEEGIEKLKVDPTYLGTTSVTLIDGSCTITVSVHPTNANYRNITVTSTSNEFSKQKVTTIDISIQPFTIIF